MSRKPTRVPKRVKKSVSTKNIHEEHTRRNEETAQNLKKAIQRHKKEWNR